MIVTLISYVIIQSIGFAKIKYGPSHKNIVIPAIIALISCVLFLILYIIFQIRSMNSPAIKEKIDEKRVKLIKNHNISLGVVLTYEIKKITTDISSLMRENKIPPIVEKYLTNFFHKYDRDNNGNIDQHELLLLMKDIGEPSLATKEGVKILLKEIDKDNNGTIELNEFITYFFNFYKNESNHDKK